MLFKYYATSYGLASHAVSGIQEFNFFYKMYMHIIWLLKSSQSIVLGTVCILQGLRVSSLEVWSLGSQVNSLGELRPVANKYKWIAFRVKGHRVGSWSHIVKLCSMRYLRQHKIIKLTEIPTRVLVQFSWIWMCMPCVLQNQFLS